MSSDMNDRQIASQNLTGQDWYLHDLRLQNQKDPWKHGIAANPHAGFCCVEPSRCVMSSDLNDRPIIYPSTFDSFDLKNGQRKHRNSVKFDDNVSYMYMESAD